MVYEEKKKIIINILLPDTHRHLIFHTWQKMIYMPDYWRLKLCHNRQPHSFLRSSPFILFTFVTFSPIILKNLPLTQHPCGSDIGKHGIGLLPKHICRSPSCSSSLSRVLQQCISAVLLNRSLLWRRKNAHCANTHNLERYQNFVTVWCLQRNLPPPTHRTFYLI